MTHLSAEQIATFREEGCVTAEGAVTADQLAEMRAVFAGWVEDSRAHDAPFGETLDGRPRFDVDPDHSADRPSLRRVASPTELHDVFWQVLTNSPLVGMVQDLIGKDLRLHHSKINSKLPGTKTEVKWHQDFTFDPHSNDDLVTCLIFLDDVTPENGPLKTVPGSHIGPLHSLRQGGRFTGAIEDGMTSRFEADAVMQTGAAGGVCLMHSRVVHGSTANNSGHPRTLFIAEISAGDALPLTANPLPSKHQGLMLAGTDPMRIRTMPFEMDMPEVPKTASFFDQQATM